GGAAREARQGTTQLGDERQTALFPIRRLRLRAVARVDAGGAEKEQLAYAGLPGGLQHVGLDRQGLEDEICGVALVRGDAHFPEVWKIVKTIFQLSGI